MDELEFTVMVSYQVQSRQYRCHEWFDVSLARFADPQTAEYWVTQETYQSWNRPGMIAGIGSNASFRIVRIEMPGQVVKEFVPPCH